jgi:hypothetical protein
MQYSLSPMKGQEQTQRHRPQREDKKRQKKPFDRAEKREAKRNWL